MKRATAPPAPLFHGSPAERLAGIADALARAAASGGHPAPTLIAVSKTFGPESIGGLLDAGHRMFGENRVQEAAAKWPALKARWPNVELHMVGRLQSNKAAEAVGLFDAIHALDRPSLVEALGAACRNRGAQPLLFAQVNLAEEPQKGGVAPADLKTLLERASGAGLVVEGLMTIPPADREPSPYFALLARMAREHGLPKLSMGMSSDYDVAATLGATHVRIGTALFGDRGA
jgi:pyridoxal phosphate enzyme (YggS family)